MAAPGDEKNRRFYLHIAAQVVALFGIFGVTMAAADRMANGFGVAIAIVGGVSLGLAVLLGKAVATDWLSLRALERTLVRREDEFQPGEIVAFSGVARVEGEALTTPFGGHRCCAFTFLVAGRRRSAGDSTSTRRANSLQGFALAPTVIEGEAMAVRLRALPDVETDLREARNGGEWGAAAHARIRAGTDFEQASEREGFGSLLVARAGPVEPGGRELFFGAFGGPDELTVEEEYVPVDEPICVIGTAEADPPGLSGRRPRFGPNIVVYRGTPEDVMERVGAETRGWMKGLRILGLIAALGLIPPFLPTSWTAAIPLVGRLFGGA